MSSGSLQITLVSASISPHTTFESVLDKDVLNLLAKEFHSLRSELKDVKEGLKQDLQSELKDVKDGLKQGLEQGLEQGLNSGLRNVGSDLRSELKDVKEQLGKELVKFWAKSRFTQTPTELGAHVKECAETTDYCVPQIVSLQLADKVWASKMWKCLDKPNARISEEDFRTMLNDVNQDMCHNVMSFTGNAQEDGQYLRKLVDFTIHIKGKAPLPCYTTGLLSLHSLTEPGKKGNTDRKYNGKPLVGHAVSRAISVMENAGPTRRRILVGVTNLRVIQWFTVERSSEDDRHYRLFTYSRSPEICEVQRSLVAVFMAKPTDLFVCGDMDLTLNGQNLTINSYLGSGVTSSVYKCDYGGKVVALKMYKTGVSMPWNVLAAQEDNFLKQLKDVPGVPTSAGVADDSSFLAIFPVGKIIGTSVPKGARKHLADLVDTLKVVHSKAIVHRDVRLGNIVLLDGPCFLLIDWGFACRAGLKLTYHGSLMTASKKVLVQYIDNRLAVLCEPEDDLVSYVKSLYLLSQPTFDRQLHSVQLVGAGNEVAPASMVLDLWEQELKGCRDWCKAISFAEKRKYTHLRDWILNWALNSCPYCEDGC